MADKGKILVVDDDRLVLATVTHGLAQAGYTVIDADNEASIRLHTEFGFEKVGHFKQTGFKFGRWLDVVYLEKIL